MEYFLQSQSGQKQSPCESKSTTTSSFKQSNPQIDFISQFLELPLDQSALHQHHGQTFTFATEKSTSTRDQIEESKQNPDNLERVRGKKSIFHNFQKHVVVTLRNHIRVKPANKKDPAYSLACKMWKLFIQSNVNSKKILHFLFGIKNLNSQENYCQIRSVQIQGSQNLLSLYTPQHLIKAQAYLRDTVIAQSQRLMEKNGLAYRRIKQNDEFSSYFVAFAQQLQKGPLSRRLPKKQKLEIMEDIKKVREDGR